MRGDPRSDGTIARPTNRILGHALTRSKGAYTQARRGPGPAVGKDREPCRAEPMADPLDPAEVGSQAGQCLDVVKHKQQPWNPR